MDIVKAKSGYEQIENPIKEEKSFKDRWKSNPLTQIGVSVSVVGTSATGISIGSVICGAIFMPISIPGYCCYTSAVVGVAGGLIGTVACGAIALIGAAVCVVGYSQN